MKLFGSTEKKITKDKNGKNLPHLEITEVSLVYCKIVNDDYHPYSQYQLFGQLLDNWPKTI